MNRIVRERKPAAFSAATITALISLMPDMTAENSINVACVSAAMILARVVLPVPGGPQKIIEVGSSCAMASESGLPGPSRCSCPTNSSSARGLMRSASGAWLACAAASSGVGLKRFMLAGSRFRFKVRGALARGFVEQQGTGDGGVEAFHAAGSGNGDARVGQREKFSREACAFVADHQRAGASQVRLSQAERRIRSAWLWSWIWNRCVTGIPALGATAASRRTPRDFSARSWSAATCTTGTRKTEPAEARRAFWFHSLTVPGVVRTAVAPKASAERTSVPRLPGLQAGGDQQQRDFVAGRVRGERGFDLPDRGNEQGGNALRMLRRDRAGEDLAGENQQLDPARKPRGWRDALAEEDGLQRKSAGERLAQQIFAFDGDQAAAEARMAGKGRAKLLDARVGAAGDEDRLRSHLTKSYAVDGEDSIRRCARGLIGTGRFNCR